MRFPYLNMDVGAKAVPKPAAEIATRLARQNFMLRLCSLSYEKAVIL